MYGKSIGTVNENLNFDIRVKGLKPIHTRVLLPEHAPGSFCRPVHTRGHTAGACSMLGTHEGAFSSLLNLPQVLASRYLTG